MEKQIHGALSHTVPVTPRLPPKVLDIFILQILSVMLQILSVILLTQKRFEMVQCVSTLPCGLKEV